MFYDRYHELCTLHGRTDTSVALELGFPSSIISHWKHGKEPRAKSLRDIAEYFGVTIDDLLSDKPITVANKPDDVPPEEGDFFFGGKDPVHPNTLSHRFEAYLKETGAKRIRIHDLRHSFVSMIIHGGASISVVANLIGDTQQQVMKTYSHFYVEDREAVLRQIT